MRANFARGRPADDADQILGLVAPVSPYLMATAYLH